MNRNVDSHFATMPQANIQRSQFDRSCDNKFTGNFGYVYPFFWDSVLPGDTFKVTTSKVLRLQTLVHPLMDSMYLDTYWFFVPSRLVWQHWKEFMGESDKAWVPSVEYTEPQLVIANTPNDGRAVGDLLDYMGLSPYIFNTKVSALPTRAYAKIMDDWFRAEALTDPLIIPDGDADTNFVSMNSTTPGDDDLKCAYGGFVFKAGKFRDYFTSALPTPQSGPEIQMPFKSNGYAPVFTGGVESTVGSVTSPAEKLLWRQLDGTAVGTGTKPLIVSDAATGVATSSPTLGAYTVPSNLYANVAGINFNINDLRTAFQVQKFYEKYSYGRRYIEVIKNMFGVTSPDSRLQRSEYLGGNRIPINVSEVTNNSSSGTGDLAGMSRTVDVHEDFVHSFTEHGYLFGVCVARYKNLYGQGIEKNWSRKTKFDYYWPVLANLGPQAVTQAEILFDSTNPSTSYSTVFGYQERFAEYRYKPDRVCAEMRPEIGSQSLASWNLADYYTSAPSLSDGWIRFDNSALDRCLSVPSSTANQFLADFYVKCICTRPMPMFSIPGLADHH